MTDSPRSLRPDSAVMQLERDDVERKRFLTMAGRSIGAAELET
jgi:hypothetical protein